METIHQDYITLNRLIGGWTDWVQGPGGNISLKAGNQLIIKQSGACLGDTTATQGWVVCNWMQVEEARKSGQESIRHTVLTGSGNPSIETFLHCLPSRIIVHLHPAFLLGDLCSPSPPLNKSESDSDVIWIPYARPGIPLANELYKQYSPESSIYMLQNHGILITGETIQEIVELMIRVSRPFQGRIPSSLPFTDVEWATKLFFEFQTTYTTEYLIQPICVHALEFHRINAFTPDLAVFLVPTPSSPPPLVSDGRRVYVVAKTLQQCGTLRDLFMSHQYAAHFGASQTLSSEEVYALMNWDKEILRKSP